jgi:putative transposase
LDVKKRFTEEQIIGFLREAEAGVPVKELCRKHGFSEASYYLWRSKFGGMSVPEAKRLKDLEAENGRLKKLLAEQLLENEVIKDALRKNGECTGPSRAGALPDLPGIERAPIAGHRRYECERFSIRPAPGRCVIWDVIWGRDLGHP